MTEAMKTESMKKVENRLKRLIAKKESLYRRVQTLHDMIPSLADEKVRNNFLISAHNLESVDFESVLDEINELEIELNPDFNPTYEALMSYSTLQGSISIALEKIRLIAKKGEPDSDTIKPFHNNLPPLEIKSFSGIVTDWPRYRDIFTSIVINNSRLAQVEKLHYLIATLSEKPAEIIKDFSLSDINFELAWGALKERYESDRILASNYFEELIKFNAVPTKPTLQNLQSYLSKISFNVHGLQNMNFDNLSDFLFFSIAIRQLDPLTRRAFEAKNGSENIPSFESLIKFVKSECRLLEITSSVIPPHHSPSQFDNKKTTFENNSRRCLPYKSTINRQVVLSTQTPSSVKSPISTPAISTRSSYPLCPDKCPKCNQFHKLYHCPQFIELNISDRRSFIIQQSRCFNCLGSHSTNFCRSVRNCPICLRRHHKLLHNFNFSTSSPHHDSLNLTSNRSEINKTACTQNNNLSQPLTSSLNISPPALATSLAHNVVNKTSQIILGTACALIKNKNGRFVKFRLLLDCASSASFITKNLVDKLGIPVKQCTQEFSGLSNTPVGSTSGAVECVISPVHSQHPLITAHALILDNILNQVPHTDLPASTLQYVKGLQLADPDFVKSRPIDMLLGCDIIPRILSANSIKPPSSEIGVLSTIFGHIIIGSISCNIQQQPNNFSLLTHSLNSPTSSRDDELNEAVSRFWEIENISLPPVIDPAAEWCEQHFLQTHRRTPDGRYIVQMPFTCDPDSVQFSQSYQLAADRFHSLESRFRKHESLKNDCINFLKEYEDLGHMSKATRPGKYFIPYFCIYNLNSPTTPARIVFDGSAKRSNNSLNQILLSGPKLQHDIPDILLNFRIEKFVFCCDISKMFRQILLENSQRIYTHILFRENPTHPLEEYELKTVTYGLAPSSFLSHRVLIQLTRDEGEPYPLACRTILQDSCVDDFFVGSDSLDGLLDIKHQLTRLLAAGGFSLNKWLSNSSAFLEALQTSESTDSLVIRNSDDDSIKVLGIGWNPKFDVFFFTIDLPPFHTAYTKRQVLSVIARIYDPLGFAAPMIFLFKCILKDIWLTGVGWDSNISPTIATQWGQCLAELPMLSTLRIPRCIFPQPAMSCHLLGFCDGSVKGSAAALYLRVQFSPTDIRIFLLKAKTRVSPSKVQTIPRIELTGAVLLSKLVSSVKLFLSRIPCPHYNTLLFTDSTIVLSWINKPPHLLKLFVSNRVVTILDHSNVSQWYHVPTQFNISDVASRGLTPKGLLAFNSWFDGPAWAYDPPDNWPIVQSVKEPLNLPEIKCCTLATTAIKNPPALPTWLLKFADFNKLQRVVAYALRFLHNSRFPANRYIGPLSILELRLALYACIRCDQRHHFHQEIENIKTQKVCSSKFQSLSPFIDNNNIIRIGGRLKHSSLSFDRKHQILLSSSSNLTHIIIAHFHRLYLHAGPRTLQALLAQRFWIPNSRRTIRQILFRCIRCSRFRAVTVSPVMGDLPAARVTPSRPFLQCGVDLAGPYILKEHLRRNSRTYKGYFALFICLAVKAVHIEILSSLSAECFIAALHRFSARRGLPALIYSDQATNFKGACRQLSEIVTFLRSCNENPIFNNYLTSQQIKFTFNCPRAPFMAGLAESNIKNVKYHLLRVIGHQQLTLEEFSTITARVEAILNSRPLCCDVNSHDDLEPLTPGHFLIGSPLVSVPDDNLEHLNINRLSRWQLVAQISQSFWRRWEREYLHTLQNKGKWFHPSPNLTEGQVVWLKEDGAPPLSYPLGRIEKVHPGSDGITRAVTVRTVSGVYRRPVRKLAPLPLS